MEERLAQRRVKAKQAKKRIENWMVGEKEGRRREKKEEGEEGLEEGLKALDVENMPFYPFLFL